MGSGIGSLDDVYDTTVAYEKGVGYLMYRCYSTADRA
jgi:hypothetical protein